MPHTSRSFVGRVRTSLNDLPTVERRLAEFVLDFPGDIASYTASELADLAGVSKATVSRFVRRLGYAGYDDARKDVRQARETGAPLLLAGAASSRAGEVQAHLSHAQANLANTFAGLSDQVIADVARAIVDAREVVVVGYRSSHAFASYLRWQIAQVVERAIVLPDAGETVGEALGHLGSRDCVIVFGLRRRVPRTTAILDFAVKAGARTLYVADQQAASHPGVTWTVHCDTSAPGPLDNHAAVIALCGMLATQVMAQAGNAGRRRMSGIEAAHDALDEM